LRRDPLSLLSRDYGHNECSAFRRREKEVLGLVAEGMTNNEIAEKLFLSQNTVDTHRKSLLSKFGAKNTASLIRMAAQMRLI